MQEGLKPSPFAEANKFKNAGGFETLLHLPFFWKGPCAAIQGRGLIESLGLSCLGYQGCACGNGYPRFQHALETRPLHYEWEREG